MRVACAAVLVVAMAWAASPCVADEGPYQVITGPCDLRFPRDHGPHPDARTEWWYYTGNLKSEDGNSFGFQLTFFRRRIAPPGADKTWPRPASEWRSDQLFLAHAALTDVNGKRFLHAGRMAREALGMAGTRVEAATVDVFVRDWSARIAPDRHDLEAGSNDFRFALALRPFKDPVLHGLSGYSRKGNNPESASCYYSFTMLDAKGTILLEGKKLQVHGAAWMDHEFSSAPLEPDLAGWDWFSIQLADGTELMIYLMRKKDGSYAPASSGIFVDAAGKSVSLPREAFLVDVLGQWQSPRSEARYPSGWRLRVPSLGLDLTITPKLQDQEMETPDTTRVTYWEGCVGVKGTGNGGAAVEGDGYVELTGYAKTMEGDL